MKLIPATRLGVPLFGVLLCAAPDARATEPAQGSAAGKAESAPQVSPQASAEPAADDEQPFNGLRATLELGTVFLVGSAYYISTSTTTPDWDLDYTWDVFRSKVTGEAFGPDANQFGTNFIGHPLGGAGYYLAARSNNGSVLRSSAFAFIGSLLWELFGEISSEVSLNDSIVTPVAGIAIGESTFQLGSYFDRRPASFVNRMLGGFFGPFKTFNETLDGVPLPAANAVDTAEQHRFELAIGYAGSLGAARAQRAHSALEVRLSERIVRTAPFDTVGEHSEWFHAGNASGIDLDLGVGRRGIDNLMLDTRAVLAGYMFRQVRRSHRGPVGGGGLIGLGTGFQYGIHDYRPEGVGDKDRIAAVRPLDVVFEQRAMVNGVTLSSYVEGGPAFGGVRNFVTDSVAELNALPLDPRSLPQAMQVNGYYFGLGGAAMAALAVGWRNIELRSRFRLHGYRAPDTPGERLHVDLSDMERCMDESLSWSPSGGPARLELRAQQRWRFGSLNEMSSERRESTLGVSLGVVL